ncbi:MAG TPA: enoyl-CoA hydratase/isomerase family protein [Burkholderiales bacterium]|nr:enoyl-CoA hydratase/isomerase family protein [Burkholderiales bacterium]
MPEHAQEPVKMALDGPVATVLLDRPDKLNALTPQMLDRLEAIATRLDADKALRCVILTGAGNKAFCVGADVSAWSALEPLDMWRGWVKRGHQVFDRWARLRLPLIAAINGHALGGGLELAAVADIRIAGSGAGFGLPEAAIGTCPGWSGTQRVARLIGPAQVKLLALTGRRISAQEAFRIGLLSEPPVEDALVRAGEVAQEVCRLAPVSAQLAKQLIDAGSGEGLAAALESMAGALAATTDDAREGKASFLEKRAPKYAGR